MTKITIEDENNKYEFLAKDVELSESHDLFEYPRFKIVGFLASYNEEFMNHTKVTPTKFKDHPLVYCKYCNTTPCKLNIEI